MEYVHQCPYAFDQPINGILYQRCPCCCCAPGSTEMVFAVCARGGRSSFDSYRQQRVAGHGADAQSAHQEQDQSFPLCCCENWRRNHRHLCCESPYLHGGPKHAKTRSSEQQRSRMSVAAESVARLANRPLSVPKFRCFPLSGGSQHFRETRGPMPRHVMICGWHMVCGTIAYRRNTGASGGERRDKT